MNQGSSYKKNQTTTDEDNISTTSSDIMKHLQDIGQLQSICEQEKQQFRAAVNHNQSFGFGYFSGFDNKMNDTSFGFQTGNLNQISINQDYLKQAMLLLQSQEPEEDLAITRLQQSMSSFSFGFGFSKGNGQSVCISASKLKQAQLLLQSQSEQIILNLQSPSNKKLQKRKTIATPRYRPSKTDIRDQKTLQSHIKPTNRMNKLLIISNSEPKTKQKQTKKKLIEYDSTTTKYKLSQLEQRKIELQDYQDPKQFSHFKQSCKTIRCFLCSQNISVITSDEIVNIFVDKFGKELQQKFKQWYHQITFKLFKYQKYYPELVNKSLTAINIIAEMENKYQKQQLSFRECFGLALRKGNFVDGIAVNLIIIAVHLILDKQYYLLELADGWYSLYSPIKFQRKHINNNYYITKLIQNGYLYPGCKIQISNWREYPVKGILEYLKCPNQFPCIEIMYNSLIKLPNISKLGIASIIYYKQLSKCYNSCGLIYLCNLMVIRIYIQNESEQLYLRLGNENESYLLRICNGAALMDEFAQKHQYQFQNLKKISGLQLESTRITRFWQTNLTLDFQNILKDVLWNTSRKKQINRTYDLIFEVLEVNQNIVLGGYKNQELRINISDFKIKIQQTYLKKFILLIQIKHTNITQEGIIEFATTTLTKATLSSKHKIYQQILKSF